MTEWLVILWLALTYWKLDDIYKLLKKGEKDYDDDDVE